MRAILEWWDREFGWFDWWEKLMFLAMGVLVVAFVGSIPMMCENARKREALVDQCVDPKFISSRTSVTGGHNNIPVTSSTYYMYECADGTIVESGRSPIELKAKVRR